MGFFDFLKGKKQGSEAPENPVLIKIITELAKNPGVEVRRALYHEFLKSRFLVPMPVSLENQSQPDGKPTPTPSSVQLLSQRGPKGELIWMAFTDEKALSQWRSAGSHYLVLPGTQLFHMAVENQVDSVLVNCAGPVGGQVSKAEIQMLAEGKIP